MALAGGSDYLFPSEESATAINAANGLAIDVEKSEGSLLSALRSSFNVCNAAECRGRRGRVGHSTAPSERLKGLQKVLTDEVANTKRNTRKNEPPSK